MTYMEWVSRLPEVGDDLRAQARRVEQLRREAVELEDEVCRQINALWSESEIRKARE
jgi:hypothetical protein